MLALLGNLSLLETLVVAVLAVLVFGKRLPEVSVRVVRWFQSVRRSLDDLRRETGIDEELREARKSIREATHEARIENPLRLPPEPRQERAIEKPPAPPAPPDEPPDPGRSSVL